MSDCAPDLGKKYAGFRAPRREVNVVYLHHSATAIPTIGAEDVDRWHRERGWSCIGYHYFITTSGEVQLGRSIERTPAATGGHNTGSIAICMNGAVEENFTVEQYVALQRLCGDIHKALPRVRFRGHKEVAATKCPAYDYKAVLNLDAYGYMHPDLPVSPPSPVPETVSFQVVRPLLSYGDRDSGVKIAQGLLIAAGHSLKADGIYGPNTKAALQAFKMKNGLPGDGARLGKDEWLALEEVGT